MGLFVSWVAFFFFKREKEFDAKEFGAFMAVIFGGTIIQVFSSYLTTGDQWIYWVYPIGLVVGMFAYALFSYLFPKDKVVSIGILARKPVPKGSKPEEPDRSGEIQEI